MPITAVKSSFEIGGKTYSRTQLPLRLAWAVTVHKSQGLTLGRTKIGLGKREFCSGLTFVALSRVRIIQDLMLVENVDYSRVQKLGGKGLQERLDDFARRYYANNWLKTSYITSYIISAALAPLRPTDAYSYLSSTARLS